MKYGVSRSTLLITAGVVWLVAGLNILRIGIIGSDLLCKKNRQQKQCRQKQKKTQTFFGPVRLNFLSAHGNGLFFFHPSIPPRRILGSRKRYAKSVSRLTPT